MAQTIGWSALVIFIICSSIPFIVWWKLRVIKKQIDLLNVDVGTEMPHVTFFGSYRKALKWLRKNKKELPQLLDTSVNRVLMADKFGWVALGLLFIVYIVNLVVRSV